MIKVCYDKKQSRLTLQGHADFAPHGSDTVCAAATILCHTLSQAVAEHCQKKRARDPVLILRPGFAEIACTPRFPHKRRVKNTFHELCLGFALLAEHSPENLTFSKHA